MAAHLRSFIKCGSLARFTAAIEQHTGRPVTIPVGIPNTATLSGIKVVERPDVLPNMVYLVQDNVITHIIDLDKIS